MDLMWFLVAMTVAFLCTSAIPYFRGRSGTSSSFYIPGARGSESLLRMSLAPPLLYQPQITRIDAQAFERLIDSDQPLILLDLTPGGTTIRPQRRQIPRLEIAAHEIFEVLRWLPSDRAVVIHGLESHSAIIDQLYELSDRRTFYLLDPAPAHLPA